MKNLFIATALLIGLSANAQLAKGRMMLGGNFNFNNSKNSYYDSSSTVSDREYKNSYFGVSARYGYFFTDHLMGGIYGSFLHSNVRQKENVNTAYPNDYKSETNTFSGGLFGRYYQMIGNSRFALFGQLSLGYGRGKGDSKSNNPGSPLNNYTNSSKVSSMTAFVNPGLVYFITNHIAVEASFGNVGYTAQKTNIYDHNKLVTEQKAGGFNSGLSFSLASLSLGVNFYFGGKNTAPTPPRNPGT